MRKGFEGRITKERVDGGQAQITAAGAQPSLLLQVIQKCYDQRSINLLELQL